MPDPTSAPIPVTASAVSGFRASDREVGADGFALLLALLAATPSAGSAAESRAAQPDTAAPPTGHPGGIGAARPIAAAVVAPSAPLDPTLASPVPPSTVGGSTPLVGATEPTVSGGSERTVAPPTDVSRPSVLPGPIVDPSSAVPSGPGGLGDPVADVGAVAARQSSASGPVGATNAGRSGAGAPAGEPETALEPMPPDEIDVRRVAEAPSGVADRGRLETVANGPVAAAPAADVAPAAGRAAATSVTPQPVARSSGKAPADLAAVSGEAEVPFDPGWTPGRGESPAAGATAPASSGAAADPVVATLVAPRPVARSSGAVRADAAAVPGEVEVAFDPQPTANLSPGTIDARTSRVPAGRTAGIAGASDRGAWGTERAVDPAAHLDAPSADGPTFADPLSHAEPVPGRPAAETALPPRASVAPTPQPPSVQIASAVLQRDGVPIDRLRVALEPAELGSVELTLTSEGRRKARALVLVDRPETLELLQREQRTLERILIVSGLELEPSGLELGLRRDGDRRDGPFTPSSRDAPVGEPARSVPSPAPARLLGLRLLDLVV